MTNKPKYEQAQRRTDFGTNTARRQSAPMGAIAIDISNKKSIPVIDALIKLISIFCC